MDFKLTGQVGMQKIAVGEFVTRFAFRILNQLAKLSFSAARFSGLSLTIEEDALFATFRHQRVRECNDIYRVEINLYRIKATTPQSHGSVSSSS